MFLKIWKKYWHIEIFFSKVDFLPHVGTFTFLQSPFSLIEQANMQLNSDKMHFFFKVWPLYYFTLNLHDICLPKSLKLIHVLTWTFHESSDDIQCVKRLQKILLTKTIFLMLLKSCYFEFLKFSFEYFSKNVQHIFFLVGVSILLIEWYKSN